MTSDVSAPLQLMLSSGEIASAATAIDRPIRLLESGPAAGAIAAAFFGGWRATRMSSRSTWAGRPPKPA